MVDYALGCTTTVRNCYTNCVQLCAYYSWSQYTQYLTLSTFCRLYDWNTMARRDVRDIIKAQAANTQLEFEQRTKETVLQFAQQVCEH